MHLYFSETPARFLFPIFWILYLIFLRLPLASLLLPLGFFYALLLHPMAKQETQETLALFQIHSFQKYASPFAPGFVYKGFIINERGKTPCSIFRSTPIFPRLDRDYFLEGTWIKQDPNSSFFKVQKFHIVENSFSFAKIRFFLKDSLKSHLLQRIKEKKEALFLYGLLAADLNDRLVRYQFGKLGLQHLLAVSGFHFGIIALFLSFFLRLFLSKKGTYIALLFLLSFYYFFLGPMPSIQRAWLMSVLYLLGKLFIKHSSPFNLLGASLLIEVLLRPSICLDIGFSLSFLSCFAILCAAPYLKKPSYSIEGWAEGIKSAAFLNLAILFSTLPLILHFFHKWPLSSLLYNLFFPLFIACALFLTLFSLGLDLFFPPLANLFYPVARLWTEELLTLCAHPPHSLTFFLKMPPFSPIGIPFYLFLFFSLSLSLNNRQIATPSSRISPSWRS